MRAIEQMMRGLTAPAMLRCASGYIYLHFGLLKFFPDLSPAELLAEQTIWKLSLGIIEPALALRLLAIFECLIGIGLLFKIKLKLIFAAINFHLIFTFAPLVIFPELTFKFFPFAPNLEGQFILKNLALLAGVWVVLFPMAFGPFQDVKTLGTDSQI